MELDVAIEKYALENAAKYEGKANPGAVIGHVIAAFPEIKSDMKSVSKKINEKIKEINSLGLEKQKKLIEEKYPELLEEKEKEERDIFAFLGFNEGDFVRTAFPPGPEKYPHIGHAKSIILNYLLAKRYNGEFYLRFEDTNPLLVREEFYQIMLDDFAWLGIKWDKLQYASDHMEMYYDFAKKIIDSGDAYVCNCPIDLMRDNRGKGISCICRDNSPELNLESWNKMFSADLAKVGSAVLRLKIDLNHENSTMRDPTIFRIIEHPHARLGTKYRVWPNYDFQNAIMDGSFDITIRIRSKEFEMRAELQRYVQKLLGIKVTRTYELARFNLEGTESSGRIIREKINNGELSGWDDPSLTTISALRRRGFMPEAIKNFVVSTGITKSDSTLTWNDLIVQNKRILEEKSNRFSFVANPVKIKIEGAPSQKIVLHLHPQLRKGGREYLVSDEFYISEDDFSSLKEGELYRLMDCLNFRKEKEGFVFDSLEHEKYKDHGKKIMHFVPVINGVLEAEILMPDKKIIKGLCEPLVANLAVNDIIQAERFGFIRLDKKENNKLFFWFTHN
jgi:glutamyl-tRNA synthetase